MLFYHTITLSKTPRSVQIHVVLASEGRFAGIGVQIKAPDRLFDLRWCHLREINHDEKLLFRNKTTFQIAYCMDLDTSGCFSECYDMVGQLFRAQNKWGELPERDILNGEKLLASW